MPMIFFILRITNNCLQEKVCLFQDDDMPRIAFDITGPSWVERRIPLRSGQYCALLRMCWY